jgi:hypothetical protein
MFCTFQVKIKILPLKTGQNANIWLENFEKKSRVTSSDLLPSLVIICDTAPLPKNVTYYLNDPLMYFNADNVVLYLFFEKRF